MAATNGYSGHKGILDCYVYYFNRSYETLEGTKLRWVCSHEGCVVPILTDINMVIKKEPRIHAHCPPDAAERAADIAKAKGKKIAKETNEKTSAVVDKVRIEVPVSVLGQLPSKSALSQQVRRTRVQVIQPPPNPQALYNLVIPARFANIMKRG
uniref:FLYWCH-type domain-containing protein n=1 Tax=Acrobeloides nanus TaxID=290746 RepID=A0A914CN55_9BILA